MKITEHIHALKIPFKVRVCPEIEVDRFVYVYVICGEKIWLIDTGVAGSAKIIFDYIESIGRSPKEIESIFLTHCHPDHIGSAKSIKEFCNCSVFIHELEKPWTQDVALQYRERPVPGFNLLVEGSVIVEDTLEDKDNVILDEILTLKIFHTPGHSAGSISYFLEQDNALFCGDAVLSSGQMPIFDNIAACINSMKIIKQIKNTEILLSSWDDPHNKENILNVLEDSIKYLAKINETIEELSVKKDASDSTEFCKQVINKLGLPAAMENSLVARSFQSVLTKK
ncbi:MAG: MBL fold metallo-hydrolase [Endomicrobiia bacterium]